LKNCNFREANNRTFCKTTLKKQKSTSIGAFYKMVPLELSLAEDERSEFVAK
jgi:hypothetical protein